MKNFHCFELYARRNIVLSSQSDNISDLQVDVESDFIFHGRHSLIKIKK